MSRVLIVEDSPTQAERLQVILEGDGLEAVVAPDAHSALVQLADSHFDLVVSDIVMPGMSGYELCREIKAHPAWRNTPVILLTTRKDPMDIFRGLECGADNFYTKPYDAPRLLDRVRHILHNRQLRAEGKLRLGVEVSMFGKTFVIGSGREQILDLLVSTFEDIVQANVDLEKARDDLNAANVKLDEYVQILEGRVRSSEGRYRAVFEGIAEGVLLLDADYNITSANPAAQRMFGYPATEMTDRGLRSMVAENFRGDEEAFRPVRAFGLPGRRGAAPAAVEIRGQRRDGTEFPLSLSLSEVLLGDERLLVAVTRDMTAEHESEQQLRQVQKIEAMGQLTGGVAHDFNNLLTVIAGNSEELAERLGHDPVLSELANMVNTAAQRGAELTCRLLAFARRQALEPRQVDVNALVAGLETLMRRTLGAQVSIRFAPHDGLWNALIDPAQLESSVLNLAINARDAMGESGGQLTIETHNHSVEPEETSGEFDLKPGDYVVVAVSDTGSGIPADLMPRILEPFFTTKPTGKGVGMGLPMVYGFVKQSGGHLTIYSEPGAGTTIRIYLPRSGAAEAKATPARNEVRGGSERILLVEDDELVRRYAEGQLRSLGYDVVSAEDGPSGLERLRQTPAIDLLFTDVVMPGGMSGKQLADEALKLRPGLRVLFSSGYAEDAIVHNGRLDPGVRLLGKPYRRAQLAHAIREAIDA